MTLLFVTRRALLGAAGIQYLLRDDFNDTLAAGAVNGTPATPGPGVRTEGGDAVSTVGGGLYNWAQWVIVQDYLVYADRTVGGTGTVLLVHAQILVNGQCCFGSDPAAVPPIPGATGVGGIQLRVQGLNTPLRLLVNNALNINLGESWPNNNNLQRYAIVLGAASAYLLQKRDTDANWLLVVRHAGAIGTALYAYWSNYSVAATSSGGALDYMRIAAQLWTPLPIASDSFDRANGPLHASLTDGLAVEEVGGAGLTWTAVTWTIAANVALNTPTLGADVIVNGGFDADTDWVHGAGWSIAAGVASIAGAASTDETAAVAPLTANVWYQSTFTLSAMAAGWIRVVWGTNASHSKFANGSYTVTGVANGTAFAIRGVTATGSIDNVTCTPITLSTLFATVPCTTPDVIVELPITDAGANVTGLQVGIVVNLDNPANPQNFRVAYLNGMGGCQLDEYVAGVRTAKITATAVVYAAGAKLKTVTSGTMMAVYYAEAQVGATQTMAANTNVNHGMFSTRATPTVNNLAIMARGTNGEYAILDRWSQ